MAKTKISEFDVDPANNTDINSINIAEGCAPSGINNAIRQLMSDLKEFQTGAAGDPFTVGGAFAANGGATLGDASGDALTINSSAVSIPNGLNFDSNTLVIDATNNNVGIGTASPASVLHVSASNATARIASTGANSSTLRFYSNSQTNNQFEIGQGLNTASDNLGYVWNIANAAISFGTNSAERMRIDSSGNVGIGTSSPTRTLQLHKASDNINYLQITNQTTGSAIGDGFLAGTDANSNVLLWMQENTAIRFGTNDTERMRIDSSGSLLVGKTASAATSVGVQFGQLGEAYVTKSTSTNADATYYLYSTGASAYRFYVGLAGTVYATSTTITGISDARLKENIRDLDDGLEKVMALQPRKFDWKEGKGKSIANDRGFIAQEFEAVFPDMIEEWRDPAPEGEEPYKAVNANLIPTLVKAIQEQQAIITDLKSRIETLESK